MTRSADHSAPTGTHFSNGNIIGILLSAGLSQRFGGNKCLTPLDNGVAMGLQSARNLTGAVSQMVCVVRPEDEVLQQLYQDAGFDIAICADANLGISASLRAGIEFCDRADGWLIALADMPWILPSTCERIAADLKTHGGIVAPTLNDKRGHPVGFSAQYANELLSLRGDQGARTLFDRHAEEVRLIPVNDPGITLDIDQPGDLTCAP